MNGNEQYLMERRVKRLDDYQLANLYAETMQDHRAEYNIGARNAKLWGDQHIEPQRRGCQSYWTALEIIREEITHRRKMRGME